MVDQTAEQYYQHQLQSLNATNISIQHIDTTFNKGCIATQNIASDTELCCEQPHIRCRLPSESITHTHNVANGLPMCICDYCNAYFTDNLPQYISTHTNNTTVKPLPVVLSDNYKPSDNTDVLLDFTAYEHAVVYCTHKCGEVYCDQNCRDAAYLQYHELLCTNNKANMNDTFRTALEQFNTHAAGNNETFNMLARIFADIYLTYKRIAHSNTIDATAMQQAMYSYQQYNNELWHVQKTAFLYHTMPHNEVDDHKQHLQALCNASYTLLSAALQPIIGAELYNIYFTEELFSRLLAAIEMNQYKLTTRSPLYFYYEHIMSLDESTQYDIIEQFDPNVWELIQREAEWQTVGSGLLKVTCCLNHSCIPNVVVDKPAIFTESTVDIDGIERNVLQVDKCDDSIVLMTTNDIQAGEQLFVSYIDETADLDERTEELNEYMFACECKKCAFERCNNKQYDDDSKMSE